MIPAYRQGTEIVDASGFEISGDDATARALGNATHRVGDVGTIRRGVGQGRKVRDFHRAGKNRLPFLRALNDDVRRVFEGRGGRHIVFALRKSNDGAQGFRRRIL